MSEVAMNSTVEAVSTPTVNEVDASMGNTHETPVSGNDWYWSENVKGEGEAPEWFNKGTFKDVATQAENYSKLQSHHNKITKGFSGAPEGDYSYEVSEALAEAGFEFNAEDPMLAKFNEFARESNMNQDTYSKALNFCHEAMMDMAGGLHENLAGDCESYLEEQLNDFGAHNAAEFRQSLKAAQNIKGVTVDGLNSILDGITTAEGIRTFQAMVSANTAGSVPTSPGTPSVENADYCRKLMAEAEACTNPAQKKLLNAKVNEAYARFYGNG